MKTIYLIRHGIVKKYPDEDVLEKKELLFSVNLPLILKEKIDFIAYVNGKNRCYDTIKHLENINNIKANSYINAEFNMQLPLPYIEAIQHDISVICYGKSEKNKLFKLFDIFESNDDYLYEIIYKIQFQKISDLKKNNNKNRTI